MQYSGATTNSVLLLCKCKGYNTVHFTMYKIVETGITAVYLACGLVSDLKVTLLHLSGSILQGLVSLTFYDKQKH